MEHTALDRFLRYVKIDTQSDPQSITFPSTEKQKDLSRLLVKELQEIGVTDVELDDYGYVYATLPATTRKEVPVICFCSHVDTSPDGSGKDVKPIVHANYDGSEIVLPDDPSVVIRPSEHPHLRQKIGEDIVTASGKTLLGADNKCGLAAIMDAAHHLMTHPEIPRGKIKILFTPDEEIGRGVDKVDLKKLGADFAYTVDGERLGSLEDETFSADMVTITIDGVSVHPGFAKGKMESAIKAAGAILSRLPEDRLSPETTAGKEGFIHPTRMEGTVEKAMLEFIIRDFEDDALLAHEDILMDIAESVMESYPNSKLTFDVTEQYRNMKEILDQHPEVIAYAEEAIRRVGVEPIHSSIRGGTDGSRLSHMGLPCPNIFAGEYAFHSKMEWTSVQDMQKAAKTIVELAKIWEEKS